MSEYMDLFRKRTLIGTIISLVVLIVFTSSFDTGFPCHSYANPGLNSRACSGLPFAYMVRDPVYGDQEFHQAEFLVDVFFWALPAIVVAALASLDSIGWRDLDRLTGHGPWFS